MAGTVPEITNGSITGISALDNRPVFFLKLFGSPNARLVVKGDTLSARGMRDADVAISIGWGAKLMKNTTDKNVNLKMLTDAEFQIFQQAVIQQFDIKSPQQKYAVRGAKGFNWVKLPMIHGLTTGEFIKDGTFSADMKMLKEFIVTLKNNDIWYKLGKVVAVDIFIGNEDRFNHTTGKLVNQGNIFLYTASDGSISIPGLDSFDPNGQFANLNASSSASSALKILVDPAEQKKFALACAQGVGKTMKENTSVKSLGVSTNSFTIAVPGMFDLVEIETIKSDNLPKYFVGYAPHFEKGLQDGALALKQYLQNKVKQYAPPTATRPLPAAPPPLATGGGWVKAIPSKQALPAPPPAPAKQIPQGILDRMKFLGW